MASNKVYRFSDRVFHIRQDTMYLENKKFSGTVYELNQKDTVMKASYLNGVPDGILKKFYPGNRIGEIREFRGGKKNGMQIAYWIDGKPKFIFNAVDDAYEGEMREWDSDGKLFHIGNYKNGQEEGTQKMWYQNGKIKANYVIKNGKRYGLLGTKNCKNVSDSIFDRFK